MPLLPRMPCNSDGALSKRTFGSASASWELEPGATGHPHATSEASEGDARKGKAAAVANLRAEPRWKSPPALMEALHMSTFPEVQFVVFGAHHPLPAAEWGRGDLTGWRGIPRGARRRWE